MTWLIAMPQGLDARKAMIIGTAGFTAMLCVMALEDAGVRPQDGEIVVTGASGGVGSTAVALLHKLGYQVVAVSGRESTHEYLKSLGASRVLPRDEFAESRPLEKQVWAGAIDTVGDKVLAKAPAQMNYGGCVAACGLAGGFTLPTTVMPFILRNVRLQGVDRATMADHNAAHKPGSDWSPIYRNHSIPRRQKRYLCQRHRTLPRPSLITRSRVARW